MKTREFLKTKTLTREMVDRFLDPDKDMWSAFDAELGYVVQSYVSRDGVDRSFTVANFSPSGQRKIVNFVEQPTRINTYGNSFTQCKQVNNGEAWQEYLAAHLGEPIRNFGVGGYGVFQAYRRMLRVESSDRSAEYMILNIWSDDHFRSVYKFNGLHYPDPGFTIPWAHLRLNPETRLR